MHGKTLLDTAWDGTRFAFWMATGLVRRAAVGLLRAVKRSLKAMAERSDRPAPPARPARKRSWAAVALTWGAIIVVLYGTAAWMGVHYGNHIMEAEQWMPPVVGPEKFKESSHVLASDGEVIYDLAEENRDYVRYADISPYVINGLIAVEDARFHSHIGVDPRGLVRAAVRDLEASWAAKKLVFPQGGSTLTQQLAKQLFLTSQKTASRKITEAGFALHLEQDFSKEEILELYLNKVFLGHNRYGVESASKFYFSKPCKDLTLAEGALLAGIPQRPSDLSPINNPANALRRRNHVLDRMAETGAITREAADAAKAEPIVVRRSTGSEVTLRVAPYFVEEVRRDLTERPETRDVLMTGGLEVETTLDMVLQRKATRALRDGLRRLDKSIPPYFRPIERNLVAEGIDPDTYEEPQWKLPPETDDVLPGVVLESDEDSAVVRIGDHRVTADKSSIAWTKRKIVNEVLHRGDVAPFRVTSRVAGTQDIASVQLEQDPKLEGSLVAIDVATGEVLAMVGGFDYNRSEFNKATQAKRQAGSSFKPIYYATALSRGLRPSTTTMDEPTTFVDAWTGELYSPENYYKTYQGRVTLREALEHSLNIPSVRLINYVGYKEVIATARRFGITADLRPYPSMALGSFEMTLLEMTSAYQTFPNGGVHVQPTLLRRIRDAKGNVLLQHETRAEEVISPQVAWQMVQLMRGVVLNGTAKEAKSLGHQVAGKTGTTDDYTDAWFIGYTPSIVVGVWTGYADEVKTIGKDQSGARAALPIWIDFMRDYFQGRPDEPFVDPGGTEFVAIDRTTGLVASPDCSPDNVLLESFTEDNRPTLSCSRAHHVQLTLPRCLQQFSVDEAGWLVVPDEKRLFELSTEGCRIDVDPIDRVVSYWWSPISPTPTQYPYRIGRGVQSLEDDSLESLMMADGRQTRDGVYSDFSQLDGRTVLVVRNDR